MITSAVDHRLKFQQMFWFGLVCLCALAMGYFLVADVFLAVIGVGGVLWLLLLPYHSKLSIFLAVATFTSALIVPLFPGRPFLWEFAALLGWSGLIVTVSMRQYAPDSGQVFRQNRWLFIGAIGYCIVLVITMLFRGFGLRILGSEQMGGRFYFQQLSCVIFPFLFVMLRPGERLLLRLFILQCLLSGSYLISDFVLSKAPEALFFLLQFFELSGDAVNFEMKAAHFGIRRFQSFYMVGTGIFFLLMIRYRLKDFFGPRGVYLIPVLLGALGLGTLSGHRFLAVIVVGVLAAGVYSQRFFNLRNSLVSLAVVVLFVSFTYAVSERLPLSVQRAISFLPGITIHPEARIDALGTMDVRRNLRKAGLEMAPRYFWLGRGFGLATQDFAWQWDPTTITGHVNQGRFYNGFIGLLVNTGGFGTFFMLLFLGCGARLSFQLLKYLRDYGAEDYFLRMCGVSAGLWLANTIAFLFLHGDSEYAMKTFSLQAGLLLGCKEAIKLRYKPTQSVEGISNSRMSLEANAEAGPTV